MRALRPSLLLCLTVACGKSPAERVVVPNATLLSVSADQQHVAYSAAFATLVGTASVADVTVTQPHAPPTLLEANGFNAAFGRTGDWLLYETSATASTDPFPPGQTAPPAYGSLAAWRPGLAAGVAVSKELSISRVAASDNAWVLSFESPSPSAAGPFTLRFSRQGATSVVRGSTGNGGAGPSPDDRFVLVRLPVQGGTEALLLSTADGSTRSLGVTASSPGFSFSSDGALLALNEAGTLRVVATASGAAQPFGALPAGLTPTGVAFASRGRLLVRTRDANNAAGLYALTAADAKPIAAGPLAFFSVPRSPPGADRYLFLGAPTPGTDGATDLSVLDLDGAGPPVPLGQTAAGVTPTVSDDLAACRFLDAFDPSTGRGTAAVALLPSGQKFALQPASPPGAFAFAGDSSQVLYFNAGLLKLWAQDHQTDRVIDPSVINFRTRSGPERIYFTRQNDDGTIDLVSEPLP